MLLSDKQEILKYIFLNNNNTSYWKDNDIINLDKFNIVDCINSKSKNLFSTIDNTKPNIIIINNQLLNVRPVNFKLEMILLDECHSISGNKIYNTLKKLKYENKIPIIGFSATPLRKNADKKLCDIFSKSFDLHEKNKKINIISSYNLFDAIKDDIVLPLYTVCIKVDKKIGNTNKKITKLALDSIIDKCPYNKFIGWCKNIEEMVEWYEFFKLEYSHLNLYMTSYKDNIYNGDYNCNYEEFYNADNNAMLICVNKCREGSDIKNLDCGIYLDAVKNRSILVAMQTSGRIIRPDKGGLKKYGFIIDTYLDGQTVETITIDKVMSYYIDILSLTEDDTFNVSTHNELYNEFIKMNEKLELNKETNVISIKIDDMHEHDVKIKLDVKITNTDWSNIKNNLEKQINNKFGIKEKKIADYDFKFSKIMNCSLNDKIIKKINYRQIISCIYEIINDTPKIMETTNFKIYKGKYSTTGYYYNKNLDISFQNNNAKCCINEIINMCTKFNIKLKMKIQLKNNNVIIVDIINLDEEIAEEKKMVLIIKDINEELNDELLETQPKKNNVTKQFSLKKKTINSDNVVIKTTKKKNIKVKSGGTVNAEI